METAEILKHSREERTWKCGEIEDNSLLSPDGSTWGENPVIGYNVRIGYKHLLKVYARNEVECREKVLKSIPGARGQKIKIWDDFGPEW